MRTVHTHLQCLIQAKCKCCFLKDHLVSNYRNEILENGNTVSKEALLSALSDTKSYLTNNFGSINITLGDFQKLVRGDKEIPIWGLPDVITAMSSRPYKDGKRKVTQGESYIGLIRFNDKGPALESIISFGNSDNPDSEHYTDQMELYQLNFLCQSWHMHEFVQSLLLLLERKNQLRSCGLGHLFVLATIISTAV